MSAPPDPDRCPLCDYDNLCGRAAGKSACWCFTHAIPADVLERVPPAARDRACVCRWCAAGQIHPAYAHGWIERMGHGR